MQYSRNMRAVLLAKDDYAGMSSENGTSHPE